MDIIDRIQLGNGYIVETLYDDLCGSPREWDTLGTIYSNHREHNPDGHSIDEIMDDDGTITIADTHYCMPIYAYIHGGISLSVGNDGWPFNDQWDSGLFGIIAVSKKDAEREFPEDTEKHVRNLLESEVAMLDDWYNGRCYGYAVYDKYGDTVDSCFGYIGGYDAMIEDAKDEAKAIAEKEAETEYATGKATVTVTVEYRVAKDTAAKIGDAGIRKAVESLVMAADPTGRR